MRAKVVIAQRDCRCRKCYGKILMGAKCIPSQIESNRFYHIGCYEDNSIKTGVPKGKYGDLTELLY